MFDAIAKQSIKNLCHYKSKRYALLVFDDFEVTFPKEEEDATFCPSFYFISFIYAVQKSKM